MGETRLVVLDTNVLVSAVGWRGSEREVYRRVRSGALRLATSPALLDELRRVLTYPKLGFDDQEIASIVADVSEHAELVRPEHVPPMIEEDPSDDEVLACAAAADVDWIVSGDHHLLALGQYKSIPVVTSRELLDLLDDPRG